MHRHILYNDEIVGASDRCVSAGQVGLLNGWGVFSTIRVRDGVLFAFERHWARMQRDSTLMRVPFPLEPVWMESRLQKLVEANGAQNATLRVVVVRNKGGIFAWSGWDRDFDLIAITADLVKWGDGVRLYLVPQGRHAGSRFAGTKVTSWSQNLTWYEEAHERGFDEVILLNERGEVSECTSANIFIVRGSEVITPPLNSGCLPGITRELLVTKEVSVPGLKVIERAVLPEELETADEVFVTSTTRNVLPVLAVEGLNIRGAGPVSQALLKAFDTYVEEYCSARAVAR